MKNGCLRQSVLLQEGKRKLEMERLSLIDVSAEDDSLIPSVSDDLGEKALPELAENDDLLESHLSPFGADASGQYICDNATSTNMNKEQSPLSNVSSPTKRAGAGPVKSSLRKSLAWDKAFFTDEELVESDDLLESYLPPFEDDAIRQYIDDNATSTGMNKEQSPLLKESSPPKSAGAGLVKSSLRKSLAWDKAFFTDEGVLNSEELALVNKTFKMPKEELLPDIKEETRTSAESNGSLVSSDLTLHDLEEKLFEQKQQNSDDQNDMTAIGNKLVASKKNSEGEIDGIHDVAIISNRTGGSKLHSENEADKRQGFVSTGSRMGGARHEMDKVRPKYFVEQCRSSSKTKSSVTEKRNSTKLPVDSTQKGPRCQTPCPTAAKKSSIKTKEYQKSHVKQPMSLSGNNGPSTSGSFTKKISSVSKCVKDTLGKVLPANMGKTSGHRISPPNAQDDFRINAKSASAPNSSASGSPPAKLTRCNSYSFERFAKPESLAYFTDDSSSIFHSSLSPASSFDGMSSVSSPTHSTSSTISPSKYINDVSFDNQNTSAIDVGFSTDEQVSEGRLQRQGLQNRVLVAGEATLANMHRPAMDDLNMTCSILRDSLTKDNSCSSGSSQLRANLSRPSGLRMPSPKIGFFDTGSASFVQNLSTLYEKSTGYFLEKKTLPPGIHARPPRFSPGGQGNVHRDFKRKPHGLHCIRPPVTSVNLSIQPNYGCALPCTLPSPSHRKSDTVFKSRIPSSPSQASQSRLNSNPGHSSHLPLPVQQKDESFVRLHQDHCKQKRDLDQHSLDVHQKVVITEGNKEDFIIEDTQSKLQLRLSNGDVCNPKGAFGATAKKSQYQLDILGGIAALQVGSEALGCEAISTKCLETTVSTIPDKATDANTAVAIHPFDQKELSFSSDEKIRCESDCTKGQLLPSVNQMETENATEKDMSNLSLDSTSKIEFETEHSYSFQNEQKLVASGGCQPVNQNRHPGKSAENRISNSVCGSKSSNEDKPNPRESDDTSIGSLVGLNTKLISTVEWPVYEDVEPVSAVELHMKGDSSPASMKLHKQLFPPIPLDSKSTSAIHDSKISGRIPLSDNCTLPITNDHKELQKQLKKEKSSIFSFAVKAARRLTISPASSPVFAEISGQENYMPEEQYFDAPLSKNKTRISVQGQFDRKEEIKNSVAASTVLEKSALEFLSEESLILDKESVQNSISST